MKDEYDFSSGIRGKYAQKFAEGSTSKNRLPQGWDDARVQRVLDHYEGQTDEEALAEDAARYDSPFTMTGVLKELVSTIRKLLAKEKSV